ncbi:hypothetical protein [Adhaeribacter aquaticus]|uniref:hypothetical protein n=1 Tax=Adhaeribacter aquaticus TaxID=299567 RepID=UPI0004121045|nr:hypothetical protein [Adhaeribacter aquaticus]
MKTTLLFNILNKTIPFLFSLTFLLSACKEDEIIAPVTANPAPVTGSPANTPQGESPAENTPPATADPTPAPVQGKSMTFRGQYTQLLEYNVDGTLQRYTSHSNGTFIHNFEYDANKKPVKATTNNFGNTRYFYTGEVLEKAVKYDLLDRPLKEYVFNFNSQNQLIEQHGFRVALDGSKTEFEKQVYAYDNKGNMNLMKQYYIDPATGQLVLSASFHYENFDNKQNAIPYLSEPYLPQVTLWVNNPGKRYILSKDGNLLVGAETYGYSYNEAGRPVSRYTTVDVGGRTVSYSGTFTYTGF